MKKHGIYLMGLVLSKPIVRAKPILDTYRFQNSLRISKLFVKNIVIEILNRPSLLVVALLFVRNIIENCPFAPLFLTNHQIHPENYKNLNRMNRLIVVDIPFFNLIDQPLKF